MAKRSGHRLHWSSPLFDVLRSLWSIAVVGLVAIWAAEGDTRDVIGGLLFAGFTAMEALRYFTTRYRLTPTALVVVEGLISHNERHIPYDRVETIDLRRNMLHRWLGVAEVRVQTSSGTEPEAVLRVLSMAAIGTLRQQIGAENPAPARPVDMPASRVLARLDPWELVRLGVVSNRSGVVLGAIIGLLWKFDLMGSTQAVVAEGLARLGETNAAAAVFGVFAVVVVAGLVAGLLSIAWAVARFHGFKLETMDDAFTISCGLFTRHHSTVDRKRIQLVSIHTTLLASALGRVAVRVETVGGDDDDDTFAQRWFAPLVRPSVADDIVGHVFPGVELRQTQWCALAAGATRRIVVGQLIVAVPISILGAYVLGPSGLVVAVLGLAIVVARTVAAARKVRWARHNGAVLYRSGIWTQRTTVVGSDAVQVLSIAQGPLDRRHGHVMLAIDTIGAGPAGHKIKIRFLDSADATRLRYDLTAHA